MVEEESDSVSSGETLDSSSLPVPPVNDHRIIIENNEHESASASASATSSSSSSSSSDPSSLLLSRNVSFSRLNAQAPEFVPRTSTTSSSSSSSPSITQPPPPPPPPSSRLVIPHPQPQHPPPPGLVHVYQGGAPPSSPFHVPIHNHPHPHPLPVLQYHHHPHQPYHRQHYGAAGDHPEVQAQQQQQQQQQQQAPADPPDHVYVAQQQRKEEATLKILNQVEYYFSDVNLATTDHLMRFISKDSEGYVPISVVASFKKIKALISSNSQLATILRSSAKLVVSEDGKKVKRQHPLTEADMEELQSRIVVAENLPEDHCHQNLMKIFSAVGSVKTIRTCPPQTSNGGSSSASRSAKAEGMLFSNKLHAFVEYETIELAEKAVADLNDEGNWRSGLRVRLLLRRTVKSPQVRAKKVGHDDEVNCEDNETSTSEPQQANEKNLEDPSQHSSAQSHEHIGEDHVNEKEGGQKKGRSRGRGKGRGRAQYNHHNRGGSHVGTPPSSNSSVSTEHPTVAKQPPGPRMPDGTRGFSMGRGKPLAINIAQ